MRNQGGGCWHCQPWGSYPKAFRLLPEQPQPSGTSLPVQPSHLHLFCSHGQYLNSSTPVPNLPRRSGARPPLTRHLLLSADVLALDGDAHHFADSNAPANIFKLQAQVLTGDGQTGPTLPGAGLREQLGESMAHQPREKSRRNTSLRQAAARSAAGCVLLP